MQGPNRGAQSPSSRELNVIWRARLRPQGRPAGHAGAGVSAPDEAQQPSVDREAHRDRVEDERVDRRAEGEHPLLACLGFCLLKLTGGIGTFVRSEGRAPDEMRRAGAGPGDRVDPEAPGGKDGAERAARKRQCADVSPGSFNKQTIGRLTGVFGSRMTRARPAWIGYCAAAAGAPGSCIGMRGRRGDGAPLSVIVSGAKYVMLEDLAAVGDEPQQPGGLCEGRRASQHRNKPTCRPPTVLCGFRPACLTHRPRRSN
eukprot:SAG11_NODE_5996_length_1414_cov_1.336882_1_plen_257_part_00